MPAAAAVLTTRAIKWGGGTDSPFVACVAEVDVSVLAASGGVGGEEVTWAGVAVALVLARHGAVVEPLLPWCAVVELVSVFAPVDAVSSSSPRCVSTC